MTKMTFEEVVASIKEERDFQDKKWGSLDECVHCGLLATKSNIARWHNDNCKKK